MAIIYLDCSKEAAGDMLAASLLELCPAPQQVLAAMQAALPNLIINSHLGHNAILSGRFLDIKLNSPLPAFNLEQIGQAIEPLKPALKQDILAVLHILAEESSLNANCQADKANLFDQQDLALIIINCYLFAQLAPQKTIAHIPDLANNADRAYAAICKYYIDQYAQQPPMQVLKCGYGLSKSNYLMAKLGDLQLSSRNLIKLSALLTAMPGHKSNFLLAELQANGAQEAYLQNISDLKNSGSQLLTCICAPADKLRLIDLIFKHSNTINLDEQIIKRYDLEQETIILDSPYGDLAVIKSYGFGVEHYRFDQQDLNSLAHELDLSLSQVEDILFAILNKAKA